MIENFHADLNGKQWWKPFLAMLAVTVTGITAIELALFSLTEATARVDVMLSILISLAILALTIAVLAALKVVLLRISLSAVSYCGKRFTFDGEVVPFVKLVLTGSALTFITAGIYAPWLLRRSFSYLVAHACYDGDRPRFLGKGRKLAKYYLIALVLPFALIIALYRGVLSVMPAAKSPFGPGYTLIIMALALFFSILVFFSILPYIYLSYRWHFNISWKNRLVSWQTDFWPSVRFLAGQLALTIATLGLYLPVFAIKCYRYFVGKTIITEDGKNFGRFSFNASLRRGFLLIWGQTLLTVITLGIYAPWAHAAILRYFVNATAFTDE